MTAPLQVGWLVETSKGSQYRVSSVHTLTVDGMVHPIFALRKVGALQPHVEFYNAQGEWLASSEFPTTSDVEAFAACRRLADRFGEVQRGIRSSGTLHDAVRVVDSRGEMYHAPIIEAKATQQQEERGNPFYW